MVRMLIIKISTNNKCCRRCGEKPPSCTVGGNVKWYIYYGKEYVGSSKIKNRIIIRPSNSTSGYILKEWKTVSWRAICTPTFTAALFTIADVWKEPKCPSTDEWISEIWYIHTMDYYSVLKMKEVPTDTTTLEDIILSEISQSQKDKYRILTHICGI